MFRHFKSHSGLWKSSAFYFYVNCCLGFELFGCFLIFFSLISRLILLWLEDTLYFNSFRFVEACFVAQDMVYFGFLGAQKNAYFDVVGWNILLMSDPVG